MSAIDHYESCITFGIAGRTYCLPVAIAREVLSFQPPRPIPGTPPVLLGMLNIRGQTAAIYSGPGLLNIHSMPPSSDWQIMLVDVKSTLYGVAVERVSDIIRLPSTAIDTSASSEKTIAGSIEHQNQLVMVLNQHWLLSRLGAYDHEPMMV